MATVCAYCNNSRGARLSREHVISKAVLQAVFGEKIRNSVRAEELFGKKILVDHEQVIRDVCVLCNSDLSCYDSAGTLFVTRINQYFNLYGKSIVFDKYSLGWLIKTHLNFLRCIPEKTTGDYYEVHNKLYDYLILKKNLNTDMFKLYIEGIEGLPYFWDAEDERHLQYFSHRSVRFISQEIIVSNLSIKALDTFVFLPYKKNYHKFNQRCKSVVQEMKRDLSFELQELDLSHVLRTRKIEVNNIVPIEKFKSRIYKL